MIELLNAFIAAIVVALAFEGMAAVLRNRDRRTRDELRDVEWAIKHNQNRMAHSEQLPQHVVEEHVRLVALRDKLRFEERQARRLSTMILFVDFMTFFKRRAGLVVAPPGRRLKRLAELFCSAEICDKVIDEMIEDMRGEYHAHLATGDKLRAKMCLWRYRIAIAKAIGTESGISSLIREIFKRVSSK